MAAAPTGYRTARMGYRDQRVGCKGIQMGMIVSNCTDNFGRLIAERVYLQLNERVEMV